MSRFAPRQFNRSTFAFEYNALNLFELFITKTEIALHFRLEFFLTFRCIQKTRSYLYETLFFDYRCAALFNFTLFFRQRLGKTTWSVRLD